jgi:hypothetical protein
VWEEQGETVVDYSSFRRQPKFDENEEKIRARQALIFFYTDLTGKKTVEGQYWSLCSYQSKLPGSEIEQLTRAGLIKKNQFYGVDISKEKIEKNKVWHPEAHWFAGDWVRVLMANQKLYNPSVVYLDSTSVVKGHSIINMVCATLEYTKRGIIFVNMMINNPHNGKDYDPRDFMENLLKNIREDIRSSWGLSDKEYRYNCSKKTDMLTLAFLKKV